MALIECPECGSEVSSKAPACPKCGNPLNMKSGPAGDPSRERSQPRASGVSDSVRSAYLSAMAAAIAADGVVDAEEIRKLYEVHALLGTGDAERLDLLRRIVLERENLGDFELPAEILDDKELRMALAKDALFIEMTQNRNSTRQGVQRLLAQIRLTPEQLKVVTDWVTWENGLLRRMGAGDESMANAFDPREIVSRAATVGVPLGALYMAGTTGFGAIGLSSGLASIGAASGLVVLGLNPMTAGIAGLIIAGVTVKKLSDHAMGNSSGETKALRKRLEEFRTVQLGAATRLAGDIPRVEALIIAEPDERWARVPDDMRAALKKIEDSAK